MKADRMAMRHGRHMAYWCCILLLGLAGNTWAAQAGFADEVSGNVQRLNAQRQAKPLLKGDAVQEGDTIVTGADSYALLVLGDGGTMSLRPQTEVKLEAFRFQGKADGTEKGLFSLVRGAFRAVTGLVGSANKDAYQIKTPTATIGIRGTDHEVVVVPEGQTAAGQEPGTYSRVFEGSTELRTAHGARVVKPGEAAFGHVRRVEAPRSLRSVPAFMRDYERVDTALRGRMDSIHQRTARGGFRSLGQPIPSAAALQERREKRLEKVQQRQDKGQEHREKNQQRQEKKLQRQEQQQERKDKNLQRREQRQGKSSLRQEKFQERRASREPQESRREARSSFRQQDRVERRSMEASHGPRGKGR